MSQLDPPKEPTRIKSWYFVNDSIIDINGARYNFNKPTTEGFTKLETLPAKDRFLNLISYLRENDLTACLNDCSMPYDTCGYYYSYKDIGNEPSDLREIVLENPTYIAGNSDKEHDLKILDQKFGLVLLALAE